MLAGQKRAPDLITDGCEPPCGCWELNSGPLEEQAMLLTAEPSLQPCTFSLPSRLLVVTQVCSSPHCCELYSVQKHGCAGISVMCGLGTFGTSL